MSRIHGAMSGERPAQLLGISGSLRSGSYSNAILTTLREQFIGRADLTLYGLGAIPPYNQDLEGEQRPQPVRGFIETIAKCDGLVIVAPEFNHSIPGVLKNALDWASRPAFTSVMAYKPVAIMSSARGSLGGPRCLEHLRESLASMLSRIVVTREVCIAGVADKIRDSRLVDPPSLDFACGAVEALLREIRLWRMVDAVKD
jgi:chromate reductase, NAD(P)H dehydrogenase (quinone)